MELAGGTQPTPATLDLPAVLGDELMRHLFKHYLYSVFSPEQLLFRERLEAFARLFDDELPDRVRIMKTAKAIVADFCRSSSAAQVSLAGRVQASLKAGLGGEVGPHYFAAALAEIDADLHRALPRFAQQRVFASALLHGPLLRALLRQTEARTLSTHPPAVPPAPPRPRRRFSLVCGRKSASADDDDDGDDVDAWLVLVDGVAHGPVTMATLQQWWRYRCLESAQLVARGPATELRWRPLAELGRAFCAATRITLQDPTLLPPL